MEQQASHAREYVAKVEDEIQRIRDGTDENLIPKLLNVVKDVVDSEDFHLNVYRETLQQNKILHLIKMNLAKKYLEMLAEIAEKKDDDYMKFYEQFGKRLSLGMHKAELLRFNTSKSGEEQISFEEYVDESTTVVSSSSFRENFRKKDYEVLYMADPVDEFAVQQPKEFDGTKLKQTTMEGLDLGDQDERKTFGELNIESELLRILMKKVLGDAAEEAVVNDRVVDSLRVLTMSEHGLSVAIQRSTQQRDSNQAVASNNCKQHNKRERKKERKGKGEKGVGEKSKKEERERELDGKEERRGIEGESVARKEGRENEVEKDVTGWTEVTRNKRKKMVQIFVKVDGMKTVAMEVLSRFETGAQWRSRAGCEAEEDTRTRRASLRRNKRRTQRDPSRSAMENQGATKVQR